MMIETERLFLREMTYDDYDALYKVLGDNDIMKYYPYEFDEKRVKDWINRNIERYRMFGFGLWAVCLKDSGEMIGDCGLTMQMINGIVRPEIGYHIRGDMQRRGYAKEAACAVRDWTFENTSYNEIYSYMKYTNEASARTALSYGCRFMGEYSDEVNEKSRYYMITRAEWEKKKSKRTETAELTVLCLVHDGENILLQDRVSSDWKGYTLPGGHIEQGESVVDAVIREIREETGLTINDPSLCGIKQFPLKDGDYSNGRYLVFLFEASSFSGELISSEEGKMYWINQNELDKIPMVEDLRDLLDVMTSDRYNEFQYIVNDGEWNIVKK